METLKGDSVLEEIPQPSEELFRRAEYLRGYVPGEFEDEDGDWATDFIIADPLPKKFPARYVHEEGSSFFSSSGRLISNSEEDCRRECGASRGPELENQTCSCIKDPLIEPASFFCNLCCRHHPLSLAYPQLSCSCLFCKPCLRLHTASIFSTSIKIHNGFSRCCIDELGCIMNPLDCWVIFTNAKQMGNALSSGCGGIIDKHLQRVNPVNDDDEGPFSEEEDIVIVVRTKANSSTLLDAIICPTPFCSGSISLSEAQHLIPVYFKKWEEVANLTLFESKDCFLKCPGCSVMIEKVAQELPLGMALSGVPEIDRTAPFTEFDNEGKPLSRSAMCHRAVNRFRCALCSLEFCGVCLQSPYHLGKTCQDIEEERNATRCIYCQERLPLGDCNLKTRSVKDLRSELDKLGVDTSWCVEKADLLTAEKLVTVVCTEKECRKRLRGACTRTLLCGHHCGGVRCERHCLPCLEDECRPSTSYTDGQAFLPSADDFCTICYVEALRSAPSIQLQCGHVVHFHCAKQKIDNGFPGPEISFGYLKCPQCPEIMSHKDLEKYMRKHLALLELVEMKAAKRMKIEGLKTENNHEDKSALELYQYYMCSKCNSPYFGGKRDCQANLDENGGHNPLDLVCGSCSISGDKAVCKNGHGQEYIEFKCCYCCSLATFFCFGRVHFCANCHNTRPDGRPDFVPARCRGRQWCPLGVEHPPHGQEFCLGCAMCRINDM